MGYFFFSKNHNDATKSSQTVEKKSLSLDTLLIIKDITIYHAYEVHLQQKLKFERTKKVFLKIEERFLKIRIRNRYNYINGVFNVYKYLSIYMLYKHVYFHSL